MRISLVNEIKSAENCWFGHIYWTNPSWKTFFFIINLFITFNQLYKTNSKIKHKKHKIIYKLYTRLYLVIYFSLTYKFARYHRWNRQKQPSKRCSVKRCSKKSHKTHRKKYPCQSLPFNKAAGQRPVTLLKNRPWHRRPPHESHKTPENIHFYRASPVTASEQIKKNGKHFR